MVAYPSQFQAAAEPAIIRAVEHGFMHHYKRECAAALVYDNGGNLIAVDNNENADYAISTIDNLFIVFCGWLVGLILALIVFILETMYSFYRIK